MFEVMAEYLPKQAYIIVEYIFAVKTLELYQKILKKYVLVLDEV